MDLSEIQDEEDHSTWSVSEEDYKDGTFLQVSISVDLFYSFLYYLVEAPYI